MRSILVFFGVFLLCDAYGQSTGKLILKGRYTKEDSVRMTESYYRAHDAVHQLLDKVNEIYQVEPDFQERKNDLRKKAWLEEESFSLWLGKPDKIKMVRRKIRRIHNKFRRNLILVTSGRDRGKCDRWTGAWAIPFGKIRIKLCENFFNSPYLQEKIIIHELGHEAGMLSHYGIHNCFSALRGARGEKNTAKRSPENYAWLAVSYLGKQCTY